MLPHDGGSEESDRPVVNLVRFGAVEPDLLEGLTRSLEGFFRFIGEEGFVQPAVLRSRRCLPTGLPDQYQGNFLLSHLEGIPGNIAIGITDVVFFDPNLPRKVFGYGGGGRSILSIFRFRRESDSRRILEERLNKEIIKILSLACDLPICDDRQCIVMYHRFMEDIDKNTTVCPTCRQKFAESLKWYLGAKNHG